jgi:hypothetical protein
MFRQHKQKGNTLALVAVCIGILVILVAFFALNYNQILGSHKQVQSAIDAAALTAAIDVGKIVVDTPMGRIALVDDAPCVAVTGKPNLGQGQGNTQFLQDARPIMGINTVMGITRLDAVIGTKLSPGGNAPDGITYLVAQELTRVQTASNTLQTAIHNGVTGAATAYDRFGNPIDFKTDVTVAYTSNSRQLVNSTNAPSITITDGWVSPKTVNLTTNVPTPSSDTDSTVVNPTNSATNTYTPYYEYPCKPNFVNQTFQFAAVASQPALIPNQAFSPFTNGPPADAQGNPTTTPETAVQVSVSEEPQQVARPYAIKHNSNATTLQLTSSAVAGSDGAGQMQAFPTGALSISFATAGGVPDAAIVPSGLSFNNVTSIMNSCPVNSTGNSAAFWPGPNDGMPQPWYQAVGGSVPATASAYVSPYPFKGLTTQYQTNPSAALSYEVYDWLKSMGLRPNVQSVVNAMNLATVSNGFYGLQSQITQQGGNIPPVTFPISCNFGVSDKQAIASDWIQPAYADNSSGRKHGVTSAILDISMGNPDGDRRNLSHWANNPEAYRRQQSNVFGYVAADPVIGDQATMLTVSAGHVTTTDGNPSNALYDLYTAVTATNNAANTTQTNGWAIFSARMQSLLKQNPKMNKQQLIKQAIQLEPRAYAAMMNGSYGVRVITNMGKNFKTLTGIGVNELSKSHFVVGGADFWPASQPATGDQIKGSTIASTGQDSGAPGPKDWCAPPQNEKSALDFYIHTTAPVIGATHSEGHGWLTQPAFAVNPPPASQNLYEKMKFIFTVNGGTGSIGSSTGPGQGLIQMVVGEAPFAAYSTLKGQQIYQSAHALQVTSGTDTVVYQVQAHDENANAYPTASSNLSSSGASANPPADYFADMSAPGGPNTVSGSSTNYCQKTSDSNSPSWAPSCPALAVDWQLTCPVVPVPCTSCPPPPTYVPHYNFVSSTSAAAVGGVSSSFVTSWCSQWDTNNGTAEYSNSQTIQNTVNESTVMAYWQVGGLLFANNADSTQGVVDAYGAGNGWTVGAAPAIQMNTSSYTYDTVNSWTTYQWIWEPHS